MKGYEPINKKLNGELVNLSDIDFENAE